MGLSRNGCTKSACLRPPEDAQITDKLHIDVTLIPEYVRDRLAVATLDAVVEWLKEPKKREKIEKRTKERKLREAQKTVEKLAHQLALNSEFSP